MANQFDAILVIDVESTCWKGSPPSFQRSEIIEIGLCPVDVRQLVRSERRSILVKPQQSEISEFCTQLTTLTPEMLGNALTLREALRILRKEYQSRERLWTSWGDYDRHQFERNCRDQGLPYPFGRRHLNVKSLFAVACGLPSEVGLDCACERLGVTLEGTHHRGHDDAWNVAGILCRLLSAMRAAVGD